ncbi:hypothetical protein VNO77_14345 [Canavalia gladiata]|uniref:Uncharacterized protein n=1 Tax=Canavalia gladiata TaxID=3824 RepID=A0AAN9LYL9_CANGL
MEGEIGPQCSFEKGREVAGWKRTHGNYVDEAPVTRGIMAIRGENLGAHNGNHRSESRRMPRPEPPPARPRRGGGSCTTGPTYHPLTVAGIAKLPLISPILHASPHISP